MKRIVFVTNGVELRAFQLTEKGEDPESGYQSEEIPVTHAASDPPRGLSRERSDLALENGSEAKPEALYIPGEIDADEVWYIAQRLEHVLRTYEPDSWHLMAPSELDRRIREALTTVTRRGAAD